MNINDLQDAIDYLKKGNKVKFYCSTKELEEMEYYYPLLSDDKMKEQGLIYHAWCLYITDPNIRGELQFITR